ncbi:MAG: hypothetical protein SX243_11975 [Acidobacteriota bacterium]|nr:hypothetical protein [Acidobacteriota bacterium]
MSEPIIVREQPFDQGPEGGMMDVALLVENGSPGAAVEFHSTTPLPDGQYIHLPPTTIHHPNQLTSVPAEIPAEWKTVFVYIYNSMGLPISPDFDFSMRVSYPPSGQTQ